MAPVLGSHRPARRLVARCVFALVALQASSALAFATLDGVRTHWPRNPSYRVLNHSPDIADGSDLQAIHRSFQTWQDVASASIAFNEVQRGGDITISFLARWPAEYGADAAGVTLTTRQNGIISAAEMSLNNQNFHWTATGDPSLTDVEGVTTHELGHAIGLDHSRIRTATMYWSGGDLELRSLDADDVRGITFLYGDGARAGLVCDTCESSDDCANGGLCLQMGDGLSWCGQPCGRNNACAAGDACYNLQGGGTSCAPEEGFCSDMGGQGQIPEGAYCWGGAQCANGTQCIAIPEGPASCMRECRVARDCAAGTTCLGAEAGTGYCIPQGPTAFGGNCATNFDCQSLLCAPLDANTNVCSQNCNPNANNCPGGVECVAVADVPGITGLCIPGGAVPEGGVCGDAAHRCGAGLECIQEATGADPDCRAACEPFGACARGRGCTPYNAADWYCLPLAGPGIGAACDASGLCAGGLLCMPTDANNGLCVTPCDDTSAQGCGGHTCFDVDGADGNLGICSPGTARFGDPCQTSIDCLDFQCVADGDVGMCSQTCSAADPCPGGFACNATQGGSHLCFRSAAPGPDAGTGGTQPPAGGTPVPTGGTEPPAGGTPVPTGGTEPPTGGTEPPTGGTEPPTGGTPGPTGDTDAGTGGTPVPGTDADVTGGGVHTADAGGAIGAKPVGGGGGSAGCAVSGPVGRSRGLGLLAIPIFGILSTRRRRGRATQTGEHA